MTKQDLLNYVSSMPEDSPFDRISAQLRKAQVIAEIEAGLEDVAQGQTVSHDEMKMRAQKWKKNR